jgi:diguanylate cyclase (GGDEF)-like protein
VSSATWTENREKRGLSGHALKPAAPSADTRIVRRDLGFQIIDFSEMRFRVRIAGARIWLTYLLAIVFASYAVSTWEGAERYGLVALAGAYLAWGMTVRLLPLDKIVHSRYRDVFFLAWSVAEVGVIAGAMAIDGGSDSPLAALLFIPLVVVALTYPPMLVLAVGTLELLVYLMIAINVGGQDHLSLSLFSVSLGITALVCAWQTRIRDAQRDELNRISRADPLTGCLNRRGFLERLDAEVDEAARTGRSFALIALDLDRFKSVNDADGHAAGDELLRWTVESLSENLRAMDSVGRLGGDEFAVLIPGAARPETLTLVDRLSALLAERAPSSLGIACYPADGTDAEELQRHADAELYAAKEGRRIETAPSRRELSWATALAQAVDTRIAVPDEHSTAVARYAATVAEEMGWEGGDLALLRMAAMLHDVGKVGIPDSILRKSGPLTEEEYDQMRLAPVTGAELVGRVEGLGAIVPWIYHAHEHMDGSGYPEGLRGDAIPLASRIIAVADAFDAMTTNRPYRGAMSRDDAVAELQRCSGTQFDPQCVAALECSVDIIEGELAAEAREANALEERWG